MGRSKFFQKKNFVSKLKPLEFRDFLFCLQTQYNNRVVNVRIRDNAVYIIDIFQYFFIVIIICSR